MKLDRAEDADFGSFGPGTCGHRMRLMMPAAREHSEPSVASNSFRAAGLPLLREFDTHEFDRARGQSLPMALATLLPQKKSSELPSAPCGPPATRRSTPSSPARSRITILGSPENTAEVALRPRDASRSTARRTRSCVRRVTSSITSEVIQGVDKVHDADPSHGRARGPRANGHFVEGGLTCGRMVYREKNFHGLAAESLSYPDLRRSGFQMVHPILRSWNLKICANLAGEEVVHLAVAWNRRGLTD